MSVAAVNNATHTESAWWFPLEIELWHKQLMRRRLIKILNQVKETKQHVATVRGLKQRGPDGSRLVQNDGREDGTVVTPAAVGSPPRELLELLAVEDRIRRLRHARRISSSRRAAVRSARKLAVLRRHPLKRAVVRLTQLAGVFTLGRAMQRLLHEALQWRGCDLDKAPHWAELPDVSRPPAELKGVWELGQSLFDFFVQSLAMRALRGRLLPKLPSPDRHVPDVALDDVAGIGAAKAEAVEMVECLMAPARFAGLGAKCPKGLLLTGPPGCGKTMLARAIAATAAVPFISRSGADFNQMFAGAGSSLVKDLFRAARRAAPSVILLDEIDYIGRRRGEERGGGLETDRSAALTQLLTEMDGFLPSEGVLVIATTNRPDILDKALLRPGRFDRHVRIPLPDVEGRLKIMQIQAKRLALEPPKGFRLTGHKPSDSPGTPPNTQIDWPAWAKRTPGFSGADLAGLINEAAMAAAREGAQGVGERHMQVAYSKALLGVPSGRHLSPQEMALTAAHESGHAVVNEVVRTSLELDGTPGFRTVAHISIVPAGGAGGVTQFAEPDEGSRLPESRRVLLAMLAVTMGGRAAEELKSGLGHVTMGARSDFAEATRIATDMVTVGGLSEAIGPRSLEAGVSPSQDLLRKVDEEVNQLLRQGLSMAKSALGKNEALHQAVSESLLKHETLDAGAFRHLVEQHHIEPITL